MEDKKEDFIKNSESNETKLEYSKSNLIIENKEKSEQIKNKYNLELKSLELKNLNEMNDFKLKKLKYENENKEKLMQLKNSFEESMKKIEESINDKKIESQEKIEFMKLQQKNLDYEIEKIQKEKEEIKIEFNLKIKEFEIDEKKNINDFEFKMKELEMNHNLKMKEIECKYKFDEMKNKNELDENIIILDKCNNIDDVIKLNMAGIFRFCDRYQNKNKNYISPPLYQQPQSFYYNTMNCNPSNFYPSYSYQECPYNNIIGNK